MATSVAPSFRREEKVYPSTKIQFPKSGAVGGMGEAFVPDLANGMERIFVPVPLSPGRNDFAPKLTVGYSIANGNGPCGMGWDMNLGAISRDIQKSLPRYDQTDEYVFSDGGQLRMSSAPAQTSGDYSIIRFHLRHESNFSRIQFWSHRQQPSSSFWVVTSGTNVTSIYGASASARVSDPANDERVLKWCIEMTYDGKGDHILYVYKKDGAQTYIKTITYGCTHPLHFNNPAQAVEALANVVSMRDYLFEAVFDYGEHERKDGPDEVVDESIYSAAAQWHLRPDAFSTFKPGFEISTNRSCRRVLMFHHFDHPKLLVRSLDFDYSSSPANGINRLDSVTQRGYSKIEGQSWNYSEDYSPGKGVKSNVYEIASIPPFEFTYSEFKTPKDERMPLTGNGEGPSFGLSDLNFQFVDLYQRGIPDLLETRGEKYIYWKNLGKLKFDVPRELKTFPRGIQLSNPMVGVSDLGGRGVGDLLYTYVGAGMYCKCVIGNEMNPSTWEQPQRFSTEFPFLADQANLRFLDLTGKGRLDALTTGAEELTYFKCLGTDGYAYGEKKAWDDKFKPDFSQDTFRLADMTGDGLLDIVFLDIQRETIHYWPNLGFGKFGVKITMENVPTKVLYNPEGLFFADVDGYGPADMVFVESERVEVWFNCSGKKWKYGFELTSGIPISIPGEPPMIIDILGNGLPGLMWGSVGGFQNYYFVALSDGKSGLLETFDNNVGLQKRYEYNPSTKFSLSDAADGNPWKGRSPSPIYVMTKMECHDLVSGSRIVSEFRYAHGYYDSDEKQFNGFGRVEQLDTETFAVQPVVTKTWFHTGDPTMTKCIDEYYKKEAGFELDDSCMADGRPLTLQGARALKGLALRQEVFDFPTGKGAPYSVTENNYRIRKVDEDIFTAVPYQSIKSEYNKKRENPLHRLDVVMDVDPFNHVIRSCKIGYPSTNPDHEPEQRRATCVITENQYCETEGDTEGDSLMCYRHGSLFAIRVHELSGLKKTDGVLGKDSLNEFYQRAREHEIGFEERPTHESPQLRTISELEFQYRQDDGLSPGQLRKSGLLALPFNTYTKCFTDGLIKNVYGNLFDKQIAVEGGYFNDRGDWWKSSGDRWQGEIIYDPDSFFVKSAQVNSFGHTTTFEYDSWHMFVTATTMELNNRTTTRYDYSTLQPVQKTDVNGNDVFIVYDPLGREVGTALVEKNISGDSLVGFKANPDKELLDKYRKDPQSVQTELLGNATTRTIHCLWDNWLNKHKEAPKFPPLKATLTRDVHTGKGATQYLHTLAYADGFERKVGSKLLATHADGKSVWATRGRTVFDNKGNPVRKYEPYFSDNPWFDDKPGLDGPFIEMTYDPIGRLTRTDHPDGTFSKTIYDAWIKTEYDRNDTVIDSRWYRDRVDSNKLPAGEIRAANLAAGHYNTPTEFHLDCGGNIFLTVQHTGDQPIKKRNDVDIQQNNRRQFDAKSRVALSADYDMAGNVIRQRSIDAGTRLLFYNALAKPVLSWDNNHHIVTTTYDELERPSCVFVDTDHRGRKLIQQNIYGEKDNRVNGRDKIYKVYDQAGLLVYDEYDFKGNILKSTRTLLKEYQGLVDWNLNPELDNELIFMGQSAFNVQNKPTIGTVHDGSTVHNSYSLSGLLSSLSSQVMVSDHDSRKMTIVKAIHYNAKGERVRIDYGNNVTTNFNYDPKSFRLANVTTRRNSDQSSGDNVQNLTYVYDPAGNIVSVTDSSDQPVFFKNNVVDPTQLYEYDSIYRIVNATGREDVGDGDGKTLSRYSESYKYDEVGNILKIKHLPSIASVPGWTRDFNYSDQSNRILSSSDTEKFPHDDFGNIIAMSGLAKMEWDYVNQLQKTSRQVSNSKPGEATWYVYDGQGNRMRKVIGREGSKQKLHETIYLNGFEIRYDFSSGKVLRRDTLHIRDNEADIAMVDVRKQGSDPYSQVLCRYQYTNQVRSVMLELDESAKVVSYEEYSPYGSTTYQALSKMEVPKRYRYAGKEKDEESGLYYYGQRYYACWLARWVSCDPKGYADGLNAYQFCKGNPVSNTDPNGTESVNVDIHVTLRSAGRSENVHKEERTPSGENNKKEKPENGEQHKSESKPEETSRTEKTTVPKKEDDRYGFESTNDSITMWAGIGKYAQQTIDNFLVKGGGFLSAGAEGFKSFLGFAAVEAKIPMFDGNLKLSMDALMGSASADIFRMETLENGLEQMSLGFSADGTVLKFGVGFEKPGEFDQSFGIPVVAKGFNYSIALQANSQGIQSMTLSILPKPIRLSIPWSEPTPVSPWRFYPGRTNLH